MLREPPGITKFEVNDAIDFNKANQGDFFGDKEVDS